MLERLQKIISQAGVTSRRAAEELIAEGRVRVNGAVVTELGSKADASKDHIKVDGKLINPKQPLTYVMLNKPAGFVTTMSDPEGRPTVQDLLKGIKVRVYPVGRLDYNTEGLLLLTNDGDFAHLITHPKHEFPKTYLAKVKGIVEDAKLQELEHGVYLDDGKTAPAKLKKVRKEEANSWLEITIHEGRKRQVRRMFDRIGHSVIRLKRIKAGNLVLGDLMEGSYRYLTPDEVQGLREASEKTEVRIPKPAPRIQKPDVESAGRKTAHKGKTPDMRPGRTVWSEEKKQGTRTAGSRGMGQGARAGSSEFRVQSSRPGASGAGPRRSSSRPGTKPEWRSAGAGSRTGSSEFRVQSSRPSAGGAGPRRSSSRPGEKPEWRSSGPRPNVGGSAPRRSAPRPGAKPDWRGSSSEAGSRGQGAGFRSSSARPSTGARTAGPRVQGSGYRTEGARPGAKPEWRSSGPRPNVGGGKPRAKSKPTTRRPIPKTMIKVDRPKGPRKK